MAAAVGVLPMILSGSSLWSPLASVIAVGLIWSMFITLLVVPVLFVVVKSRRFKPSSAVVTAMLIAGLISVAKPALAQAQHLTLPEAVELALKGNSALKIARFKVNKKAKKVDSTPHNGSASLGRSSEFAGFHIPWRNSFIAAS